ncbi:MAG: trypsin-like peptidase domain-containing protein [Lachnospiraceae bacterium]|nr:trypsin-like peptidase domain-containing protein [Lachnospiraceae bacterium]
MNDDFFNNFNQNNNETLNHYNETDVLNKQTAHTKEPAPEPVVSEPYRYKYENGEKRENPNRNEAPYYQSAYNNYNYGSAYHYDQTYNTTSHTTAETPVKKKKRPFIKALKWVAGAACFGIIAGAAFLGTSYLATEVFDIPFLQMQSSDNKGTATGNTSIGTGTPVNITLGTTSTIEGVENPAENVVVQVVEQNMAATVAVKSTFMESYYSFWGQQYQQEAQGSGSGFIVGMNETELLIATNNHVIDDATKIEITFIDDTVLEATIKGTDSIADLAIIAVPLETISADTLAVIRVATLGNSEEVRLGEMAIAIGNALGYGQSVTVGYISAKDRTVSVDGNEMILLQTDAAINGGNSGGPLFNTKGEVIGINSVKYADTNVEGMCFAIPISRAIPILNELMTRETLEEDERVT